MGENMILSYLGVFTN